MTWIKKALSRTLSEKERRYSMKLHDVQYLYGKYENNPFELIWAAFRCGFEKGKRYEKDKQKRNRAEERYTITPKGIAYLDSVTKEENDHAEAQS